MSGSVIHLKQLGAIPLFIEPFDFDILSWFQQLARMKKMCTIPIVLTLTFL